MTEILRQRGRGRMNLEAMGNGTPPGCRPGPRRCRPVKASNRRFDSARFR